MRAATNDKGLVFKSNLYVLTYPLKLLQPKET